MKQFLLSAACIAMSAFSFAQVDLEVVSIDDPGSDLKIDELYTVAVTVMNNGSADIPANSGYYFNVTLDGSNVPHPVQGQWVSQQTIPITAGGTAQFILAQNTDFEVTAPQSSNLCVSLNTVLQAGSMIPDQNQDANLEACETVNFDWANSVTEIAKSDIQVYAANNLLNIDFGVASNSTSDITVLGLSGQTFKSEQRAMSGMQQMNVSDLVPGLYLVHIKPETGSSITKKIVIK